MKTNVTFKGQKAFADRLVRLSREMERTTESIVKQEARALAVELGAATMPLGFNEESAEAFRKRVEGDVRRVFISQLARGQIYKLIARRSTRLAAAYLRAMAADKPDQVRRILREAGVKSERLDPAELKAARTGSKGRVPKDYQSVTVVSEGRLASFVRKQRLQVGVAKAGWYCAAKGLGGRVRRNIREADGKRRTEEIFPAYIRKLARRYPDLGGARFTGGLLARAEIWTAVRYAGEALPAGLFASAVDAAQKRFREALAQGIAEANRSRLGVAA